jgi:co-chaperonin GroES (HSP10)
MQERLDVHKVIDILTDSIRVRGERVAIYLDKKPDTFGNSSIIKAELYNAGVCRGTIVAIGDKLCSEDRDRFQLGDEVMFNYTGAAHRIDEYELDEGTIELAILSILDLNVTFL